MLQLIHTLAFTKIRLAIYKNMFILGTVNYNSL